MGPLRIRKSLLGRKEGELLVLKVGSLGALPPGPGRPVVSVQHGEEGLGIIAGGWREVDTLSQDTGGHRKLLICKPSVSF